MRDQFARFGVGHLIHHLEAFDQIAAAQFFVRHVNRSVAVHAGAGLFDDLLAFGERLIVEHKGVAALFAEVFRRRHNPPTSFSSAGLLRSWTARRRSADRPASACAANGFAAAVARADLIDRAFVIVVLQRKVLAPDCRVIGFISQFDDAIKRIAAFLLALENVDEQHQPTNRAKNGNYGCEHNRAPT